MIHILVHASDANLDGYAKYAGLVTINNADNTDSSSRDAKADLARVVFLSRPGLYARCAALASPSSTATTF